MSFPPYADLYNLPEDERIGLIGHTVMHEKKTVAFMVDAIPADKADRYLRKLQERFPGIVVKERIAGPVKDVITIKLAPPAS